MISRAMRGEGLSISTAVRDLVMSQGKSILVHDVMLDQNFRSQESIRAQEIRSILAVPLQTAERVIGLLYLDSPHTVRKFTPEDLNLVTVMANIAAIRIEHARLSEQQEERKVLERELEHAAEIQRRLLPSKASKVGGFDLAGCSVPCRAGGGDYYDFLPCDGGRIVVLIGDVSGKGLGAALLMSNLQACAHLLFEDPELLSAQVSRLNRRIADSCPGNAFITLFVAVLDSTSRELAYCNAGHNPALVIRKDGNVDRLPATEIPLGVSRAASFEENTDHLSPDDLLVLFSDGVTEAAAHDESDEFGEQRLIAVAQQNRERPAVKVMEAIYEHLASFTQRAPARDGITLLVARCCDA